MGGEKFDTPQPEAYLFGENMDLNFFSKCPTTVSWQIQKNNNGWIVPSLILNEMYKKINLCSICYNSPKIINKCLSCNIYFHNIIKTTLNKFSCTIIKTLLTLLISICYAFLTT